MGYIHIESLYKCPDFFENFKEIYCMEKIHGTSTWIKYERDQRPRGSSANRMPIFDLLNNPKDYQVDHASLDLPVGFANHKLIFHSGGEPGPLFKELFNEEHLLGRLNEMAEINNWSVIKIHGEGYGGKQQGMKETYGCELKFVAFDVYVENCDKATNSKFLDVPDAENLVINLGLEFVHYIRGPNIPEWIEQQSNCKSIQAVRNGMGKEPKALNLERALLVLGEDKNREGVVIKPINEGKLSNGKRAIVKHKNAQFWQIKCLGWLKPS